MSVAAGGHAGGHAGSSGHSTAHGVVTSETHSAHTSEVNGLLLRASQGHIQTTQQSQPQAYEAQNTQDLNLFEALFIVLCVVALMAGIIGIMAWCYDFNKIDETTEKKREERNG